MYSYYGLVHNFDRFKKNHYHKAIRQAGCLAHFPTPLSKFLKITLLNEPPSMQIEPSVRPWI